MLITPIKLYITTVNCSLWRIREHKSWHGFISELQFYHYSTIQECKVCWISITDKSRYITKHVVWGTYKSYVVFCVSSKCIMCLWKISSNVFHFVHLSLWQVFTAIMIFNCVRYCKRPIGCLIIRNLKFKIS